MQNHYIIHKTIHHSPLLTLIFLHILSTRAANDRPYTLSSFPSHFVGATIGRTLSHTLPVRWHMTALPSFVGAPLSHILPRSVAYNRPTLISHGRPLVARYPICFPLGRSMTAPTHFSLFLLISHGRPLVAHLPYTKIPQPPHLPLQTVTKYSIIRKLHIKIERSHNKWNKRKKTKWV